MTAIERVRTILKGGAPDRPVLFDLLRNNAVLEYYSGKSLAEDTAGAIYGAVRNILDSTRSLRFPSVEGHTSLCAPFLQLPIPAQGFLERPRPWVSSRQPNRQIGSPDHF